MTSRSMVRRTSATERFRAWSRLSQSSAIAAKPSASVGLMWAGFSPFSTAARAPRHASRASGSDIAGKRPSDIRLSLPFIR